jgi:hypothetical protein
MISRDDQLYCVYLPTRKRRLATITLIGLLAWFLVSREPGPFATLQFGAILMLAGWAGMASLWFP